MTIPWVRLRIFYGPGDETHRHLHRGRILEKSRPPWRLHSFLCVSNGDPIRNLTNGTSAGLPYADRVGLPEEKFISGDAPLCTITHPPLADALRLINKLDITDVNRSRLDMSKPRTSSVATEAARGITECPDDVAYF